MNLIEFKNLPDTSTPINAENLNNNFGEMKVKIDEMKIESGTNDNGSWIKFADGTMICRNTIRLTGISTVVPSGGVLPSSESQAAIPFPMEFIEEPQLVMTPCRHNSWIGYGWRPTTTATPTYAIFTNIPASNFYIDIQYIAIGRWK